VRRLFELEVPEIFNGTVEIKSIAREPGYRSKVAVAARQEGVDAIGACVGLRGIRIQNIINELHGEKIDVIEWHADASQFVAHALSPAPVLSVSVNEEDKTASVVVPDRQLSLAIGKEGQNARLAAKLTGWRIDIKSASLAEAEAIPMTPTPSATALEEAIITPPAVEPAQEEFEGAAEPLEVPAAAELTEEPEAVAPSAEEAVVESEPWRIAEEEPLEPVAEQAAIQEPQPTPTPAAEAATAAPGRIRFAEEIFGETRGKKTKGRKERDEEPTGSAKPAKKGKRAPRVYEEDELEEESDLLHLPTR
jgi:N utilization substance protein A